MNSGGLRPQWQGSVWVGALDIDDDISDGVFLAAADGYARARLLVRRGRVPIGFVELVVRDGWIADSDLAAQIAALPSEVDAEPDGPLEPISVVLCTRDRPELLHLLRRAGRGLLHTRHMTRVEVSDGRPPAGAGERSLAATELRAIARGPFAYVSARRAGARKAPLTNFVPAEGLASRMGYHQ
jgi:hypothetical protein